MEAAQLRVWKWETILIVVAAPIKTHTVASDDSQAGQLLNKLDNLSGDLVQVEKDVFNRVRSPVNHSDPIEDLTKRIKDQEVSAEERKGLDDPSALQHFHICWSRTELT